MKSLNLNKVAAVGAGLALVAASVAGAVNWSDLVDSTNHTMKVNGIVVGSNALPEDTVAANMLASALADKAFYMKQVTETTTAQDCVDNADVTFTEDAGKEKKYADSTDFVLNKNTGSGKLDSLVSETKSNLKLNSVSLSATFKETLTLTTDVAYDDDEDVQEYLAEVNREGFDYSVELTGTDLNLEEANNFDSGVFTDESEDYLTVPFLGEWYLLDKATVDTDDKIELVKTSAPTSFALGETISALGKDGKTYTVKVADGYEEDSNNFITLELYDSTGKLLETEDYDADSEVTFYVDGEEVLADSLYVDSVRRSTQASSDVFSAKIRTGAGRVVLENGNCYPDYTETDLDECNWSAVVDITDNVLVSYGITNTKAYEFKNHDGLKMGEYMLLPGNYAGFEFVGFDTDDTGKAVIGGAVESELGSENGVYFVDEDGVEHNVPFYYTLGEVTVDEDGDGANLTFDGIDYTLGLIADGAEVNLYLEEGTVSDFEGLEDEFGTDDYVLADDAFSVFYDMPVYMVNDDLNLPYYLAMYNDANTYSAWLVLASGSLLEDGITMDGFDELAFEGTDMDEDADVNVEESDYNFYVPASDADFLEYSGLDVTLEDDENFAVARFYATLTASEDDVNVYVDAKEDAVLDDEADDLSYGEAVEYQGVALSYSDDSEVMKVTDDNGATVVVDDAAFVTITSPKDNLDVLFNFYDKTGIVAAGQTCTDKETTATVDKEVLYEGLPFVPMKDTEASTGKYIVVGGYMVNSLFPSKDQTATLLGAPLAAEGDTVIAMNDGHLYVAGYTKEDTQAAVEALIAELEKQ